MRGWSIRIGRIFGTELRLGSIFVLLLPLLITYAVLLGGSAMRGVALWLLLLAAVVVREIGRAMAASYFGRSSQRMVLLPTGAVPPPVEENAPLLNGDRIVALSGPIANFLVGVTLALLMYSVTSQINLFERPYVIPSHLLRSAIWTQILLGGLNLLPAVPLDAGIFLRRQLIALRGASAGARAAGGLSQPIGWLLILAGVFTQNVWLMVMGGCVLMTAQNEAHSSAAQESAATVTMAEVMLDGFTTMSASATLEDALASSVHSLQEAYPVLRGSLLVGTVTRSQIAEALRTDGNGYVQSIMSRQVAVCAGSDLLVSTLRGGPITTGTRLIAVVDQERVLGIVTTQTLGQTMALLGQARRLLRRDEARERRGSNDRPGR